jgi:hypothetical protein
VNKSGQVARQIFSELDRRLKSADKKEEAGSAGERGDGGQQKQKRKTAGDRAPDTQTTSTTDSRTIPGM